MQLVLIIAISFVGLLCIFLLVKLIKWALNWRTKALALQREIQLNENEMSNIGYQSEIDHNQLDNISVISFETAIKDSFFILPSNLPSYDEYVSKTCNPSLKKK